MKNNSVWMSLHLFGAQAEGETEQAPVPTPQAIDESGDTPNESASAAGECSEAETRRAGFRAMMEGEYKDLFTAYFQETFNRRFKEQKEMKAELTRANVLLDEVAAHFGVERNALQEAIRAENEKKNAPADGHADDLPAPREREAEQLQQAVEAAVSAARAEAERSVLAAIRSRGLRPSESALSTQSLDALRGGAGRLSRAQRAEVARRAAKGERIKL